MWHPKKSKRERAGDLLSKYLKIKTTTKAAKGLTKVAKWTAYGEAAKGLATRTPNKVWLALGGGLGAAALAAAVRRNASSGAAV